MSISVRPINEADKTRLTPSGKQIVNSSPMTGLNNAHIYEHNVVSSSIFGEDNHSGDYKSEEKIYEDRFTRVGRIDLVHNVLNPFLAGRKAPVWRRVLGLSTEETVGIVNGDVVYDTELEELVSVRDVASLPYSPDKYVFGADVLSLLLDKADLRGRLDSLLISTYLYPVLDKEYIKAYEDGEINLGRIYTKDFGSTNVSDMGDMTGWLFENFFIDLESGDLSPEEISDTYEALEGRLGEMDTTHMEQFPLISLLSSMCFGDGKQAMKSQIMSYVFVLPIGYRPTIDNRVDVLTSQYNRLVNVNLELRDILDQYLPSCITVFRKYKELVAYVRNIFIGDDYIKSTSQLQNYKSLSDTITGKEGLMRGRMQGVRVDYSGRAVITCDPYMPIDCIGVPRDMLYKIAEPDIIRSIKEDKTSIGAYARTQNLSRFSTSSKAKINGMTYGDFVDRWAKQEPRYGIIGRQPTLFYLGIRDFKIMPVDGDALVLSPLVVMPFNADFDGDQMHFNMPQTKGAINETKHAMSFLETLRYPKNGELTVVTRHEIIYGLWICSVKTSAPNERTISDAELKDIATSMNIPTNKGTLGIVYEAACTQKISVYDKVATSYGVQSVGVAALEYALYGGHHMKNLNEVLNGSGIKAGKITELLQDAYSTESGSFLSAINRLGKLGFSIAKIWPPNISTIVGTEIETHVKKMIDEFNHDIHERERYVDLGIEIESEFSNYFNTRWNELKDGQGGITKYLLDNLNEDNGYISMMKSGGKGDKNNILQIFGLKGRVQKNDVSAFNSIIAGSYARELTGLEGFISAYGSRKGIADKVLATAEPGYLSRKLEHAGSIISIRSEDCGTSNGIEFTLDDIVPFLDESQISKYGTRPNGSPSVFCNTSEYKAQLLAAREYLSKILIGRYCVDETDDNRDDGSDHSILITDKNSAYNFINRHWGYVDDKTHSFVPSAVDSSSIVKMRSPIYCTDPCCKKCYGKDITTGRLPELGRNVGFIAAQAIGEPGTQLTMKNFQKGGVVTDANLTSSFKIIEDYFELHDLSTRKAGNGAILYDVISPIDATVKEQYMGNGTKRVTLIPDNPDDPEVRKRNRSFTMKQVTVYDKTKLKHHVYEGDSLQAIQGNLNMKEVLAYRGFDKAATYLSLILYNTFTTQDVAFKHFETIVASMSVTYLLNDVECVYNYDSLHTGEKVKYKAGTCLTWPEIQLDTIGTSLGVRTLLGLKALPKYKNDFLESILMENMDTYIPRAILMNPNDSMTNPITRAAFGLNL